MGYQYIIWPVTSEDDSHLGRTLEVLDAIPLDVVVRPNRLLQLVAHDHSGSFGCGTASEQHDTSAAVRESCLKLWSKYRDQKKYYRRIRTSSNPTATLNATPVQRSARLSFATGHGSRESASRIPVNWNSHCWTGIKKRAAPNVCGGNGWPGRGAARFWALRPSIS